nr:M23 family metallopeptidase [Deinococcus yavapaiensis]
MRRVLAVLIPLALLIALAVVLWPYLRSAARMVALLREPEPKARSLPDPLPGTRFLDTWGGARSEGRRHEGVDIFAPLGTPIRSTTKGVVTRVTTDRLGGNVVYVLGPGGFNHYYAHLARYGDVRGGQWIEAGTVIGYVGNTGNARSTPPHLHYGVYTPTWTAINPYPLLRREWEAARR